MFMREESFVYRFFNGFFACVDGHQFKFHMEWGVLGLQLEKETQFVNF